MAMAKITGQGLTAIATLVCVLCACLLGERIIVRNANAEAFQAIRALRQLQMQKRSEPASVPVRPPHPQRPVLG